MIIGLSMTGGGVMGYVLGVDLGTTYTAAATFDPAEGHARMLGLGNRALQIPSVLYRQPDGTFLVGESAERRGTADPANVVREFKRRIGDHVPILIGNTPYSPQTLTARLLRWVVNQAIERIGTPPDSITLTHPANWGTFKIDLLLQAAALADLDNVTTCSEPEAAARQYSTANTVEEGDRICVYDLGGGTFDAAVLLRTPTGFETIGTPDGIEHLGGIDFDEAVFRRVLDSLPADVLSLDFSAPSEMAELARLRRDCTDAKEVLSTDVDTVLSVGVGPHRTSVRLTRSEFEDMIRPALQDTIGSTTRALRSANTDPADLTTFVLVGGSSRIPLVTETLTSAFRRPVARNTHPKHDIALGAVQAPNNVRISETSTPTSVPTLPLISSGPAPAIGTIPPPLRPMSGNARTGDTSITRTEIIDTGIAPDERTNEPSQRKRTLMIIGAAAVVVAIVIGAVAVLNRGSASTDAQASSSTAATNDAAAPSSGSSAGPATSMSATPVSDAGFPPVRPLTVQLPQGPPLPDNNIVAPRTFNGETTLSLVDSVTGVVGNQLNTITAVVPVLTPDRRSIVYLVIDDQRQTTQRIVASDGSGDRALFATPPPGCASTYRPAWNPLDPNEIAITCLKDRDHLTLNIVGLDGTLKRTLDVGQDQVDDLTWSPDGKTLAFWAGPATELKGGAIYTMAVDGGSPPEKITQGFNGGDADPIFSPDGNSLLYRRWNFDSAGVNTDTDIAVMNVDGSNVRVLAQHPADDRDPAWSPDGMSIVFKSNRDGDGEGADRYWLMDAEGQGVRRLYSDDAIAEKGVPAWSRR